MRNFGLIVSVLLGVVAVAAEAETGYSAPAGKRSHLLRDSGPRILVIQGAPAPGVSNGNNHGLKGVLVYERPHLQPFGAVAAQEVFEWHHEQRLGVDRARSGKRRMEIASHAVESLVANRFYGFDLDRYERWEAASMRRYPHLRGMSEGEIAGAMRASRVQAEKWVRQNAGLIRALVEFRFPRERTP